MNLRFRWSTVVDRPSLRRVLATKSKVYQATVPVPDVSTYGICKENTSKDPSSQCENLLNLQEIYIQVKRYYVGTLTTSEVMTRLQRQTLN